jgi:hypothetical protein
MCGTLSRSWSALLDLKAAVTFLWLFVHAKFIEIELEVRMTSPLLGCLSGFGYESHAKIVIGLACVRGVNVLHLFQTRLLQ